MQTLDPQSELQKLLDVLASFPLEQQEALAAYYRAEAEHIRDAEDRLDNLPPEQVNRLRALIQEGIDSGTATPIDFEAIKREGRERLAARREH